MCLLTIFSKVSDFAKGVIFRLLVLHITAQGDIVVKGFSFFLGWFRSWLPPSQPAADEP
jgi:hypothetical protein